MKEKYPRISQYIALALAAVMLVAAFLPVFSINTSEIPTATPNFPDRVDFGLVGIPKPSEIPYFVEFISYMMQGGSFNRYLDNLYYDVRYRNAEDMPNCWLMLLSVCEVLNDLALHFPVWRESCEVYFFENAVIVVLFSTMLLLAILVFTAFVCPIWLIIRILMQTTRYIKSRRRGEEASAEMLVKKMPFKFMLAVNLLAVVILPYGFFCSIVPGPAVWIIPACILGIKLLAEGNRIIKIEDKTQLREKLIRHGLTALTLVLTVVLMAVFVNNRVGMIVWDGVLAFLSAEKPENGIWPTCLFLLVLLASGLLVFILFDMLNRVVQVDLHSKYTDYGARWMEAAGVAVPLVAVLITGNVGNSRFLANLSSDEKSAIITCLVLLAMIIAVEVVFSKLPALLKKKEMPTPSEETVE